MSLAALSAAADPHGLAVVGAFHPKPEDGAPEGAGTLALLGPAGPVMWEAFSHVPERGDGGPDPLDRWSRRVIGEIAGALGAEALFPFGGPPWAPFHTWAARGEHAVGSPVGMLASPERGLWASYRGAVAFRERLDLPARRDASPCAPCPAPCRTACPVDAFASGQYDVPRCTAHISSAAGAACRAGCLVRRACPAGAALALPEEQRRFHMAAFLAAHG